jgi:hypothetical protein
MSDGDVVLPWADGEHTFNIRKIGPATELQDKCGGVGVGTIMNRLLKGNFFVADFREVIRLGLIGGGMRPVEASDLTKRYVDDRPWQESVLVATAIITAAIVGTPKEHVGKKGQAEGTATETVTAGSSAPPSTELEPQ